MRTGTVVFVNVTRGMFAIQLDDGSYSVVELLDSEDIENGMVLVGALDEGGSCTVADKNSGTLIDVYVQLVGCNRNFAISKANM